MIGVVVVTHGQLATELVNATETIVGDLPRFAAVSIGWHEDTADAREEIAQAIARVDQGQGVLILTDMFGGTPCNLAMTFLEERKVEVITGVNVPILIKLSGLQEQSELLSVAREMREHGRHAICVLTSRSVTVVNALGLHARAAARFVHLAAKFTAQVRVARDAKVMDGKSIMGILLLAAARGTTITISADGADEQAAVDALAELVLTGFGEATWNA
jgi:PTS system mannose-specific IIA component